MELFSLCGVCSIVFIALIPFAFLLSVYLDVSLLAFSYSLKK